MFKNSPHQQSNIICMRVISHFCCSKTCVYHCNDTPNWTQCSTVLKSGNGDNASALTNYGSWPWKRDTFCKYNFCFWHQGRSSNQKGSNNAHYCEQLTQSCNHLPDPGNIQLNYLQLLEKAENVCKEPITEIQISHLENLTKGQACNKQFRLHHCLYLIHQVYNNNSYVVTWKNYPS